jgi:hypothetical protein
VICLGTSSDILNGDNSRSFGIISLIHGNFLIVSNLPNVKTSAGGRTTAVLASIAPHLKDHANYKKIYKAIAEAGRSPHSHGEMELWARCVKCQRAANERLLTMKALGFTSKAMYLTWLKIHQQMDSVLREPLPKYNKP